MESSLVAADWWWTVWFDILFTFSQLLNLHPCCRIRETKWVQRTISLYQYKLFKPIPIFCNRVLWGSYVQTLDTTCVIEIRDSFCFLTTWATSFRIMTPYFTMWMNKYSAKDSVYWIFTRSWRSALFITPSRICSKGNPENQRLFFFYLLLVARLRFSLVYLYV